MKEDGTQEKRDRQSPSRGKPDWTSFFALEIDVPEDFLAERDDSSPQSRELLWLFPMCDTPSR